MTTVLNSKPRCNIMAESNTKNIRYLVSVVITVAIIFVVGIGFSLNVSAEENFIPFWIKSSAKFWVEDQISDTEFMKTLEYLINTKIINIPDKSYSEEYEKMEKRVADLEKQNQQLLDRNYANPTTSNSDLGFYINQLEQENEILEETNAELISMMEEVEVMLRNEIPNVQKLEDENKKLKEENQQLRLLFESSTTSTQTKTSQSTLEKGASSKFSYSIEKKIGTKQTVNSIYDFFNGDTWVRKASADVVCYMSDGDIRTSKIGFSLSVLPYEKMKKSVSYNFDVNNSNIQRCEIMNEKITPSNRIIVDTMNYQMAKCEPQLGLSFDGSQIHTGAIMRGLVTNNDSEQKTVIVNYRAYDEQGIVIASRIPPMDSNHSVRTLTIDAGQTTPLGGYAEIKDAISRTDNSKVSSCKVVLFQEKY